MNSRLEMLLRRGAQEIWDGCYVNLGIGLPCKVLAYVDASIRPFVHSENGLLGVSALSDKAQLDAMCIDAGGAYVQAREGGAFFDSSISFAMIRKSRLDLCMLGAFEVDQEGNLANWKIPGKFTPGIGGAIELAQKSKNLIVLTTCLDKFGQSKIKKRCTLPLTAARCVRRIITDLGVIDCTPEGLVVREMFEGVSWEEFQSSVEAPITYQALEGEMHER